MGFKKGTSPKDVAVTVPAPWKGEGSFTFYFTKRPPKEAMDAGEEYFAATGEERADERRKSLVRAVSAMMTREPSGFDDFPRLDEGMTFPTLAQRAAAYFDDPNEPDLEKIISAAWNWYLMEASPRAYLKSVQDSGARDGQLSGVPVEAPPGV